MTADTTPSIPHNDPRPLPSIIAQLNRAAASGILAVTNREGRREMIFVDGEVRAARSNIESEKLGSWLVGHKVISIQDKALGLMTQGGTASPFGHLLVTRGLIDQATLEQKLQDLALAIVERATIGARSRIDFAVDVGGDQLDTLPNITTPQLILIAGRAFPKAEAKREQVGDFQQQAWLARSLATLVSDLQLTAAERRLLEILQQPLSIEELEGASGLDRATFLATFYPLVAAGTVAVGESKPADRETLPLGTPAPRLVEEEAPAPEEDLPVSVLEQRKEREFILRAVTFTAERNHYENLGLTEVATEDAVRASWARLQKLFHPRRAAEVHLADIGPQLSIVYERLREGFEVLSDPASRRMYDQSIARPQVAVEEQPELIPDEADVAGIPRQTTRVKLASAHVKQAEQALLAGDLFTAHTLLEVACDLDPQPEPILKLARIMLFNPNWAEQALDKLRLALELNPRSVDGWLVLADFWRRRDHKERQRKALERALAADPGHADAIGAYRELVGDEQAERFLTQARGH